MINKKKQQEIILLPFINNIRNCADDVEGILKSLERLFEVLFCPMK